MLRFGPAVTLEGRTLGNADAEVAVDVRDDAVGGAGHDDGSADDRITAGIHDLAVGHGLGESRPAGHEQSQTGRERQQRPTADRER